MEYCLRSADERSVHMAEVLQLSREFCEPWFTTEPRLHSWKPLTRSLPVKRRPILGERRPSTAPASAADLQTVQATVHSSSQALISTACVCVRLQSSTVHDLYDPLDVSSWRF